METETTRIRGCMTLGLGLLVAFSGLCTIFVLVATAAQAWQEHAQAQWPEVTGRVEKCGLSQSGRRNRYYIHCRFSYEIGPEQHSINTYSATVPSADTWQYPPNQIDPYEDWVKEHQQGTPIVLRYDPSNHRKVVLAASPMPRSGARTPQNIKLLEIVGGSFLVLLTIARLARPRSFQLDEGSSRPLG
jgi:Protein of unknown function (DUF3592)